MPDLPTLSLIVPVLDEAENLPELLRRVRAALDLPETSWELLFVDDGSTDGSRSYLEECAARDPRVRVVALSRNFGHQAAISAGLDHARGQAVAIMDADLQDPPETVRSFLAEWRKGSDIVYGVRRKRKESFLKRLAYAVYYRFLGSAADISIPVDSGDFCLMDRRVVDVVKLLPERGRFVRGLRAWVGLKQTGVEYERDARHAGATKYTMAKLYSLGAEGVVGFSIRPLKLAMKLGFLMASLALGLVLVYLFRWLLTGSEWPRGFASIFIGLCLMFGIQFILIGILGEYIGSIHTEVKGRPSYVVDRLIGFGPERSHGDRAGQEASGSAPASGDLS